jgi:hypothetical protein
MSKKRKSVPWVASYDSESGSWLTWDDMQQRGYRERQARQHHVNSNHPFIWILQSNALHVAARLLWRESDAEQFMPGEREKVALMLAGMSIECAVKARMIMFYKYPLSPEDQKKVFGGSHNLVKLVSLARIRTNKSDRKVLGSLSMYIRWLGRYPTPRSAEEMLDYWFNEGRPDAALCSAYCVVRDKIGVAVSRALDNWRAV